MQDTTAVAGLLAELREYVLLRVELFRAKGLEQGAKLFADLVTNTMVLVCFLLSFLFGSLTLGFFLSDTLSSIPLGFGLVVAFYILVAIIAFLMRHSFIEKLLVNFTVRKLLDKYFSKDAS